MHVNIGNSLLSVDVFTTYIHAVQLANQRAANFVERALILEQLSTAAMPAETVGRATALELARVSMPLAHMALKAVRDRQTQLQRAEGAAL